MQGLSTRSDSGTNSSLFNSVKSAVIKLQQCIRKSNKTKSLCLCWPPWALYCLWCVHFIWLWPYLYVSLELLFLLFNSIIKMLKNVCNAIVVSLQANILFGLLSQNSMLPHFLKEKRIYYNNRYDETRTVKFPLILTHRTRFVGLSKLGYEQWCTFEAIF